LDGTLVKHNGYLIDGHDTLLPGVMEFLDEISPDDKVVIITSRASKYKEETINFLHKASIRYDNIVFDAPLGERILVNDKKPSGLMTAVAVNLDRDVFPEGLFAVDKNL